MLIFWQVYMVRWPQAVITLAIACWFVWRGVEEQR